MFEMTDQQVESPMPRGVEHHWKGANKAFVISIAMLNLMPTATDRGRELIQGGLQPTASRSRERFRNL